MANAPRALYGTTSIAGSVPGACNAGPVYSKDGFLVLEESFTDFMPVTDERWLDAGLAHLLSGEDFVEEWRIWDCEKSSWALPELALYRFDMYDLSIRRVKGRICSWLGAIDVGGRVLASRDESDCDGKCWQWLRVGRP